MGGLCCCTRCHFQSPVIHCFHCTLSVQGGATCVGGGAVVVGMYGRHPSGVTGRGRSDPSMPALVQSLLTVSTLSRALIMTIAQITFSSFFTLLALQQLWKLWGFKVVNGHKNCRDMWGTSKRYYSSNLFDSFCSLKELKPFNCRNAFLRKTGYIKRLLFMGIWDSQFE